MNERCAERFRAVHAPKVTAAVPGAPACCWPCRTWSSTRRPVTGSIAAQLAERNGDHKLLGSFRVCITTQGTVASVCLIKTTGYSAYDLTIVHAIWSQWRYRPFIMNGVPKPACTTVTFVYTHVVPKPARCDAPR